MKLEQLEHDFEIVSTAYHMCRNNGPMGRWGSNGLKFIHKIGKRISAEFGEPRSTVFLMQAIGMAVLRRNAARVLGTVG